MSHVLTYENRACSNWNIYICLLHMGFTHAMFDMYKFYSRKSDIACVKYTPSNNTFNYLGGHAQPGGLGTLHNDDNIFLQLARSFAFCFQLATPKIRRVSSTWSFQRSLGRPIFRLPSSTSSNIFRAGSLLSILLTWPSQRNRVILIRLTMSMSGYSSYNSWFIRLRYSPLSIIGPYIFRSIFLSKTPSDVSSACEMTHDSAP